MLKNEKVQNVIKSMVDLYLHENFKVDEDGYYLVEINLKEEFEDREFNHPDLTCLIYNYEDSLCKDIADYIIYHIKFIGYEDKEELRNIVDDYVVNGKDRKIGITFKF